MKQKLKHLYREMKKSYLGERAQFVPERYWSQFVCLGSASDWHYFFKRVIPKEKRRVLIVGVHGGRDYFYFKSAGYEVVGQDLFPDKDYGDVIVGNIENVSLPERSFDVIVASAIVEHVPNDYTALTNIRRALKDDGIFVMCIPLYNDWEVTHMHIYSRKTAEQLLKSTGFTTDNVFAYPNLFFWTAPFNLLQHAVSAFTFLLFHKTAYQYTLPLFWKLEFFLSKQHSLPFRLFRSMLGKFFNGTLLTFVSKKTEAFDHLNFNKTRFDTSKNHS